MQHASALDLAAAIRAKEVAPSEAMEESLSAIDAHNERLNAIIWLDADDARARAKAADDRIANDGTDDLPPFFGVPLPIKDLTAVEGWPATFGSAGASEEPVPAGNRIVDLFEDAGFVLCGRSNSPEFGTITATENTRYGITRNPWNTDHTSGGSSGGASSATAGSMFTIAHASDGGGSIRIPASCTGLVGLKPSRGRIVDDVVGWEGAATNGVVSHTVADTAAALDALSVVDPLAWWNAPPTDGSYLAHVGADPGSLRVAVLDTSPLGLGVDPECVQAVATAAAALESVGHSIVDVSFDAHVEEFIGAFVNVVNAGLAGLPVDWDHVQPHNQHGRAMAQAVTSLDYVEAVMSLQLWTRKVNAQWGGDFDLLLTPTMPIQPAPAGKITGEITDSPTETSPTVLESVSYTAMFNMNGLPAISLPVHQASDSGLPIGAQLVAGPLADAQLLSVAAQVEQAAPWAGRRAPVA